MSRLFGLKFQPKLMSLKLGKTIKKVDCDKMSTCSALGNIETPDKYSLLDHSRNIRYNQKDPSCVANSLVMSLIVLHSILYPDKPITPASVYALYYWSRQTHGAENMNTGTFIFACIEAANAVGIPLASSWNDKHTPFDKPDWSTYTDADPNKPLVTERIYDLDDKFIKRIKETIAIRRRPIQFGMSVDTKFTDWEYKKESDIYEYVGPSLGGHAMAIVGYDDVRQNVEIINSHGRKFGNNGVVRMGYNTAVKQFREATIINRIPVM